MPMIGTSSLPPALQLAAPLFKEAGLLDVARSVFATADAGGFRVYMDDACGTPADWRDHLRLSSFVINVSNARTQQAPIVSVADEVATYAAIYKRLGGASKVSPDSLVRFLQPDLCWQPPYSPMRLARRAKRTLARRIRYMLAESEATIG